MIEDILNKWGEKFVQEIQANIRDTGTDVTGKTSDSVKFSVENNVLVVVGTRPYFATVETGSKPSKKKPSPEMVQSLKEWAQDKPAKISAYGAAVNILKNGSKLWQKGGRKDIYSNVLEKHMEQLKADIMKDQVKDSKEIIFNKKK